MKRILRILSVVFACSMVFSLFATLPRASETLSVATHVLSVKLNKTSLSLMSAKTFKLVATVSPSNATNKKLTWKSSNSKIASVSSTGLVKVKAKGIVTITVTSNEGKKTAKCKITVYPQVFTGYFVEAVWGDYLHMDVKTLNGKLKSFWVLKNVGLDVEKLKKGQKIKVTWQNADVMIPESGGSMNLNEVLKVVKV